MPFNLHLLFALGVSALCPLAPRGKLSQVRVGYLLGASSKYVLPSLKSHTSWAFWSSFPASLTPLPLSSRSMAFISHCHKAPSLGLALRNKIESTWTVLLDMQMKSVKIDEKDP
ncbi:hypothetical protein H1C71_031808 [Ictidomys tridecemlineatus]|nr:hypothetical protein H1C71_031808 [Ictidomys tridecemlineatus]